MGLNQHEEVGIFTFLSNEKGLLLVLDKILSFLMIKYLFLLESKVTFGRKHVFNTRIRRAVSCFKGNSLVSY